MPTIPVHTLRFERGSSFEGEQRARVRVPSTEELFPQWLTGRIILEQWVSGISGWHVGVNSQDPHTLDISISCCDDLLSLTPPEDQDKVWGIYTTTIQEYVGAALFEEFLGGKYSLPSNAQTFAFVKSRLCNHEQDVIACGGLDIRDTMARAFGLRFL